MGITCPFCHNWEQRNPFHNGLHSPNDVSVEYSHWNEDTYHLNHLDKLSDLILKYNVNKIPKFLCDIRSEAIKTKLDSNK